MNNSLYACFEAENKWPNDNRNEYNTSEPFYSMEVFCGCFGQTEAKNANAWNYTIANLTKYTRYLLSDLGDNFSFSFWSDRDMGPQVNLQNRTSSI